MTSDEVVAALVRDLQPVAPLPRPGVRVRQWLLIASASTALAVAAYGVRSDLVGAVVTPELPAATILLLVATVSAAGAALVLTIPGERLSPVRLAAPVAAIAAWGVWLVMDVIAAVIRTPGAGTIDFGWGCVAKALTFAAIPGAALFAMVGRGAPIEIRRALIFAALATAGVGAIGVEFVCPKTESMHLLIWHFGPVVVFSILGAVAGVPLFTRWRRRHASRP